MYTVDYFINKFEAIPEEMWCIEARIDGDGRRCAHGHCYVGDPNAQTNDEEDSLSQISIEHFGEPGFADINNGYNSKYNQPTPKQRILAALYDIKANQALEQAKEIINDSIPLEACETL